MFGHHNMTFGDLGQLFDGPHATPKRMDSGPYFLNISSLNAGRLDLDQSDHVSEDDFLHWTRRVTPQENDLLFSYETRLGEAALMPGGVQACLGRRMALMRPNCEVVHPRFLLYYYLSPPFQQLIEQHTIHGATVNRIGLSTMGNWPISIPPLDEQRAIAEVLGALDDKIAANTKLVHGLDELFSAHWQALSQPESGTQCRLNSLVADLFAGDWGASEKTATHPEEVLCIRGADLPSLQTSGSGKMPTRFLKPTSLKRRELHVGDIVMEASGGSPTQSTGRAALITDSLLSRFDVPLSSSNFCKALRMKDSKNAFLVYGHLRNSWERGEFFQYENGTTGIKNLALTNYFNDKEIRLPDDHRLQSFNDLSVEIFKKMQAAGQESDILAVTRDALLPQLMSGKLRVRDIETTMGEMV